MVDEPEPVHDDYASRLRENFNQDLKNCDISAVSMAQCTLYVDDHNFNSISKTICQQKQPKDQSLHYLVENLNSRPRQRKDVEDECEKTIARDFQPKKPTSKVEPPKEVI